LQFAREYRVGHIIIGNSGRKIAFWQRIQGKQTIVERLINESRGINIIVLDTREEGSTEKRKVFVPNIFGIKQQNSWKEPIRNARVILWESVIEKEEAFRELLHECCIASPDIDETTALSALLEREKQGETFIGEEIAILHARLENLKKPVIVIGVNKIGIYDQESGNTSRIMFLILSPHFDPNSHIRMLGLISKMVSESQWRSKIFRATSKNEIIAIVREKVKQLH
jgi:two-component system sensor histidine kinase KdpD